MNEAMLDRFDWTLEQDYATKGIEKKILLKKMNSFGNVDSDFATLLTNWADTIRKAFADGIVDEIITTRRLENVCKAFAIFNDRETALNMALARFDDDTKVAFRDFYAKMDDTITEGTSTGFDASQVTPDTILNLEVDYHEKEVPRSQGARWNDKVRKWQVDGDTYLKSPEFFNNYSPSIVTTETCPF